MAKRIIVSVISDLVTDQRVHKVCRTLHEAGYEVSLTGARRKGSLPLQPRQYRAGRIRLFFQKNFAFYGEFNIRLFIRLLFTKGDIFLGNDLDVMPAVWLAGWLRRKPVVYDTHEYYLGMPELHGRKLVTGFWTMIERFIFPRLIYIYTICESFCVLYKKDYGKELRFVRNVPYKEFTGMDLEVPPDIKSQLPVNKHFLLLQGAGINPERGVEELVLAMKYLDPDKYHLVIVGGGDIIHVIKKMVQDQQLADRITILPKVPFEVLRSITREAGLGLSLDKPTNINHIYGLPNKIFDYIHSGVPVLISRLVELEKIMDEYQVGGYIENHEPRHIASRIEEMFSDPAQMEIWKRNSMRAREELNWELEGRTVLEIFEQVQRENS